LCRSPVQVRPSSGAWQQGAHSSRGCTQAVQTQHIRTAEHGQDTRVSWAVNVCLCAPTPVRVRGRVAVCGEPVRRRRCPPLAHPTVGCDGTGSGTQRGITHGISTHQTNQHHLCNILFPSCHLWGHRHGWYCIALYLRRLVPTKCRCFCPSFFRLPRTPGHFLVMPSMFSFVFLVFFHVSCMVGCCSVRFYPLQSVCSSMAPRREPS
jgi:hypothetical protein